MTSSFLHPAPIAISVGNGNFPYLILSSLSFMQGAPSLNLKLVRGKAFIVLEYFKYLLFGMISMYSNSVVYLSTEFTISIKLMGHSISISLHVLLLMSAFGLHAIEGHVPLALGR